MKRETYRGEKLTVRKGRQLCLVGEINGCRILEWVGRLDSPADVERVASSLRSTIDDAKARPAAYRNGYGEACYGMTLA